MPCIPLHFFTSFSRHKQKFHHNVIQVSRLVIFLLSVPCYKGGLTTPIVPHVPSLVRTLWVSQKLTFKNWVGSIQLTLTRYIMRRKLCWCCKIRCDSFVRCWLLTLIWWIISKTWWHILFVNENIKGRGNDSRWRKLLLQLFRLPSPFWELHAPMKREES